MVARAHVVVPRGHVQIFVERIVVEAVEPAHEVVGDPDALAQLRAQRIDLHLLVLAIALGDETLPVEHQPRVVVADRRGDLLPVGVGLAPVGGGPARVQLVQAAVARLEKGLELAPALGAVADPVVLVIELPADDVRVLAEALAHHGRDPPAVALIDGRVDAEVAAVAVLRAAAILVHGQRLGVRLGQPGRRRGRRRAEHDRDAGLRQLIHRALQPVQVELAVRRLHGRPGKLAQPRHVEAGLLHEPDVLRPPRFGPVFRVIGGAQIQGLRRLCAHLRILVAPTRLTRPARRDTGPGPSARSGRAGSPASPGAPPHRAGCSRG
ncbi:MAG: hypothetical protein BWY52_01008 [Chloroflexi bacterium ADurb.Bin325]|nr:MAG: hypothetical protein BWY52_01008 [Chloroflexi bacterium ADurb.Bin325]